MKSIYFNTLTHRRTAWLLFALLCVGITGCSKELPLVAPKGEPAYISLSTKALNPGIAGSQINTVRVILINPAANHIITLNEFVGSPADPLIIPIKTGTYDVYVVANEEANNRENTALSNVYNLPTLRAVHLEHSGQRNNRNMPMFGEVKNVTITAPLTGDPSTTNLASVSIGGVDQGKKLPVELTRMFSKLNVKIISKYKDITASYIQNQPRYVPIFEDVLSDASLFSTSINRSNYTLTESIVDPAANILEGKDIIIPSFLFAPATNESRGIVYRCIFNGYDNLSFEVKLGHIISEATKDYTIKRNHNYEITITIKDKLIFTVVTLKPWTSFDDDVEVL